MDDETSKIHLYLFSTGDIKIRFPVKNSTASQKS